MILSKAIVPLTKISSCKKHLSGDVEDLKKSSSYSGYKCRVSGVSGVSGRIAISGLIAGDHCYHHPIHYRLLTIATCDIKALNTEEKKWIRTIHSRPRSAGHLSNRLRSVQQFVLNYQNYHQTSNGKVYFSCIGRVSCFSS